MFKTCESCMTLKISLKKKDVIYSVYKIVFLIFIAYLKQVNSIWTRYVFSAIGRFNPKFKSKF